MDTTLPKGREFNKHYQELCKHLRLKGLQPKTVDSYSRGIRRMGNYFDSEIDNLSEEQLLDYFDKLLSTHSFSAVKLDLYGYKFYCTHVLKKPWKDIPLIKPPKSVRIPDILTIEQVNELLDATRIISYKMFFFTLYSLGLRLSEGIHLKTGDIDAARMRVHIRDSKGNKDRLVPLPQKTLAALRQFWRVHKNPVFVFPSRERGLKNAGLVDYPMGRDSIQKAIRKVVNEMGIKKKLPATRYAIPMPRIYWSPG